MLRSNFALRRFFASIALALASITAAYSQARINDKDLESMMRNLRNDAKAFRSPFNSALKKSTIRKTSEAKDAQRLADTFAGETESLLNNFKRTKKGDQRLSAVQSTGQQLAAVVDANQLGPDVSARWNKIQIELQKVLSAYSL